MTEVDLAKLRHPFPREAVKQRAGGGNRMLSYVEGFTVMRRLNEACPSWDFAIVREWQDGNLMKAHVRLTIPGLGSREHVGVQVVNDRPGTEDVQAKGHITDGLKKAATLFGVGLELYRPDYEHVAESPVAQIGARRAAPPAETTRTSTNAPAPRTGQGNTPQGDETTQRQLRYLEAVGREAGLNADQVTERCMTEYGVMPSALTKRQCSALIDLIQGKGTPGDRGHARKQAEGAVRAGPGPSSQAQHGMLRGLAKQTNPDPATMSDDRWLHGQVFARFRIAHLADLSKQHASQLIDWFQKQDFIECLWPVETGDQMEAHQQGLASVPDEPDHIRNATWE